MYRPGISTAAILLSLALSTQGVPLAALASEIADTTATSSDLLETSASTPVSLPDDHEGAPSELPQEDPGDIAEGTEDPRVPETPDVPLNPSVPGSTTQNPAEEPEDPYPGLSPEEPNDPGSASEEPPADNGDAPSTPEDPTPSDPSASEPAPAPATPTVEPIDPDSKQDAPDSDERASASKAPEKAPASEVAIASADVPEPVDTALYAAAPRKATLTASLINDGSSVAISASGGQYDQAWNVAFKTTSATGTRWQAAKKQSSGEWTCIIPATTLGSGKVTIEAWASIGSEAAKAIGSSEVKLPTAQASFGMKWDSESNRLVLTATSVSCPSGVTFVSAGVSAPNGGVRWYQLSRQDDGSWKVAIKPADFNWAAGTYRIEGSICDAQWRGVSVGSVQASIAYPGEGLKASVNTSGSALSLSAQGGRFDHAWGVSFAITGSKGTVWVSAKKQSDGSWTANAQGSRLGAGDCSVAAWANIDSTPAVSIAQKSVSLPKTRVDISMTYDADASRFKVTTSQVTCPSGVRFVSVGVTSPKGTTKWYRLEQNAKGQWEVLINPADFGWVAGTYTLVPSVCDTNWNGNAASNATAKISFGTTGTATTVDSSKGTVTLTATGILPRNAQNLAFAIDGEKGTTWHQAKRQSDGSWTATIEARRIGSRACTATPVVTIGGTTQYLTKTSFSIGGASGTTVVASAPSANNTIPVTVSSVSSKTGIQKVSLGVFNGTASHWYACSKNSKGDWTVSVPLEDFRFAGGTYTFEAVVVDSFGNSLPLAKVSKTYASAAVVVDAEVVASSNTLAMTASGGSSAYAWGVSFAVTDSGGSTEWIAAQKQSNGSWTASIPASRLTYGSGHVTAYVNAGSSTITLGTDYFNRLQPSHVGMSQYIQNYSSPTSYLLAIDTGSCYVGVYSGSRGHWEEVARWSCSPGAASTPTVTGIFSVTGKGYSFDSFGSRCFYYTQFYGDYLFHSTLFYPNGGTMDDRLGLHLSHGCVRLNINNAKWIYDNIPLGTTVVSY